jgi:hypothetical protein
MFLLLVLFFADGRSAATLGYAGGRGSWLWFGCRSHRHHFGRG